MYSNKLKTSLKLAAIVASIFILAGCGEDAEEDLVDTAVETECTGGVESSETSEATTPVDTGDTADTSSASTTEE